jgi:hypothetical protein
MLQHSIQMAENPWIKVYMSTKHITGYNQVLHKVKNLSDIDHNGIYMVKYHVDSKKILQDKADKGTRFGGYLSICK